MASTFSEHSNAIILAMMAAGYWYLSSRKRSDEDEPRLDDDRSFVPWIAGAVLLYSLKDQIQESVKTDHVVTAAAISASNYLWDKGVFKASVGALLVLVVGPAIVNNSKQ